MRQGLATALRPLALAGVLALTASCSGSLDPSDWYASTVGEAPAPEPVEPVPGEDEDYPNLAEVPEEPENVSTPEEIELVAETLAADLANAQYTTDVQRADDETTPAAMPEALALPEVEEIVDENTTVIEAGGEIEIVEAQPSGLPEPEPEPEAGVDAVAEAELAEAVEAEAGTVEVVEEETVVVEQAVVVEAEPMLEPEPMPMEEVAVVDSRVQSETVRDESGELVGTITRVVTTTGTAELPATPEVEAVAAEVVAAEVAETEAAAAAQNELAVVEQAAVVEQVVVAEPAVEEIVVVEEVAIAEPVVEQPAVVEEVVIAEPAVDEVVVEQVVVEDEVVVEPEAMTMDDVAASVEPQDLAGEGAAGGTGQSLVAQSERTVVEDVVVVPEYAAELALSEVEAVEAAPAEVETEVVVAQVAAEPVAVVAESRVEQQTVVDEDSGELVGSVTRTVAVVEQPVVAVVEPEVVAVETDVVAVETVVAEPEMAAVEVVDVAPATTGEIAEPVTVDFGALLDASGPEAGTGNQPVATVAPANDGGTQAAFTGGSGTAVAEQLAAVIRFGDGSAALGATERDIIRQLAAVHRERGGFIRLVGHASRSGGSSADETLVNFEISLDRATAVADELIRQGVPRGAIVVEAAGASATASADAAQDRRVDVFLGA